MMTYSAGSSDSYRVDVTFCADYSDPLRVSSARMLNRKTSTSSCTDKFLAMCPDKNAGQCMAQDLQHSSTS